MSDASDDVPETSDEAVDAPTLVQIDEETAMVFGDVAGLDLPVEAPIFSLGKASELEGKLAQVPGFANLGLQAADGYLKANGLVRLSPDTLKALKAAQPLQKDGWNLGVLMKDGKFAQQVRWAPAGGAGAVGVLAAIGPAAALIAIQYQLGKIAAAVERGTELTGEVLQRLRAEQWSELHGLRKVMLEALGDARQLNGISDGLWGNIAGKQESLEKHRMLYSDAVKGHLRKLKEQADPTARRDWFKYNASAVLMDAASLVSAHEAWFVYQGLRAAHLLNGDKSDRELSEIVAERTRLEHAAASAEVTGLLDQLERALGELEDARRRFELPFGKGKRNASDVRRMSSELRRHVARVRGDTFLSEPPVPPPVPVVALRDGDFERELRERMRWQLAVGEVIEAVGDAELWVGRDIKRSYQVLTDRRLLVVARDMSEGVRVMRELARSNVRYARFSEGAEATREALELRLAATDQDLVFVFPDWAKDEAARAPARHLALALQHSMNLPADEIPGNPVPAVVTP